MKKSTLAGIGAAALVAACGGGGDDGGAAAVPPTTQVPLSAWETPNGFISYLMQLVAAPADTLEPVPTTDVTGPTDDTSEPTTVD